MDRLTAQREYDKRVVRTMIGIYCRANHHSASMCQECQELLRYVGERVDSCPLGAEKTTCVKCSIHCYDATHRQQIRSVMRYAGPRLIFRHPVMALRHLMKEKL